MTFNKSMRKASRIISMPYTIYLSEDRKYIVLKHWGEMNREFGMKRVIEAHKLGGEIGINMYLVDLTEAINLDYASESLMYAYEDLEIPSGINRTACVAMLVSPDDHSHDFVETVLRNAGHNVTLFRDRELAIKHLSKET
jgi:hypothetical protein